MTHFPDSSLTGFRRGRDRLKRATTLIALSALTLSGCVSPPSPVVNLTAPGQAAQTQQGSGVISNPIVAANASSRKDISELPGDADAVAIELGSQIAVNGAGATVTGNTVTITDAGTYRLS